MAVNQNALISYSHAADGRLAPAFQGGMERQPKPLLKRRAINVFRDQTSLTASPALWPGIDAHLAASEWFLLFASPESAASQWCAREMQCWLQHRTAGRLLIGPTRNEIAWDRSHLDFDWERTSALSRTRAGRLSDDPLFVDLLWARDSAALGLEHAPFREAVVSVCAPVRQMLRDELDGADLQ